MTDAPGRRSPTRAWGGWVRLCSSSRVDALSGALLAVASAIYLALALYLARDARQPGMEARRLRPAPGAPGHAPVALSATASVRSRGHRIRAPSSQARRPIHAPRGEHIDHLDEEFVNAIGYVLVHLADREPS